MATFEPTAIPQQNGHMRSWIATQMRRIADAMKSPSVTQIHFAILTVEPERFTNGDVVMADGVFWNPGGGAGLYLRNGGAWVKL